MKNKLVNLDRDCLAGIVRQYSEENASAIVNALEANGVTTVSKLENLPARIGTARIAGVPVYELVSFVMASLKATGGCPDKEGGAVVAATYKNVLSETSHIPRLPAKKKTAGANPVEGDSDNGTNL